MSTTLERDRGDDDRQSGSRGPVESPVREARSPEPPEARLAVLLRDAAEEVPPPPAALRRLGIGSLAFFGPGAIIASLTIGSGEMVWVPRAAVAFGLPIVWTFFYGIWVKAVINYLGNKWYALTGEPAANALARTIGSWFVALLTITILVVMPTWMTVLGALSAQIVFSATGQPLDVRALWAIIVALTIGMLLAVNIKRVAFTFLERAQQIIVILLFITFWAAVILTTEPDWGAFIVGLFVPTIPGEYEPWIEQAAPDIWSMPTWLLIGTALGSLGGGVQDYIGYVGMLREKGWGILASRRTEEIADAFRDIGRTARIPLPTEPALVDKLKTRMRAVSIDTIISYTMVFVVTIAVALLTLYVMRPAQQAPTGLAMFEAQAGWLTNISPSLGILFWLGAFAAVWGTFYGSWEVYSWTTYELMRSFRRFRNVTLDRVKLYLWPYLFLVSGALFLTGASLPWLAGFASALTHLFALAIWGFSLLWIDRTQLPKEYRAPMWLVVVTFLGAAIYLPYGIVALAQAFGML